jgi:hypothetical protein
MRASTSRRRPGKPRKLHFRSAEAPASKPARDVDRNVDRGAEAEPDRERKPHRLDRHARWLKECRGVHTNPERRS